MTRFKYCFSLLTILLFVACGQNEAASTEKIIDINQVTEHIDTLHRNSDSIHWMTPKQYNPISLLNAVVIKNDNDTLINVITVVDEFPVDWVKQSDIDTLVTLIKSKQKCNCFLNPLSSYIPTNESADIGGYAIIFINSFRQKTKVELGLYSCPKTDKQSVTEITKWWTNYKQTK